MPRNIGERRTKRARSCEETVTITAPRPKARHQRNRQTPEPEAEQPAAADRSCTAGDLNAPSPAFNRGIDGPVCPSCLRRARGWRPAAPSSRLRLLRMHAHTAAHLRTLAVPGRRDFAAEQHAAEIDPPTQVEEEMAAQLPPPQPHRKLTKRKTKKHRRNNKSFNTNEIRRPKEHLIFTNFRGYRQGR